MDDDELVHRALPPRCMVSDDPEAADEARKRLKSPNKRLSWAHIRRRRDSNNSTPSSPRVAAESPTPAPTRQSTLKLVQASNSSDTNEEEDGKDVYRWAVLYENQRGLTIFSTPYYSSLSLLPNDPPPFTIPSTDPSGKQPKVSLEEYPLPDGNWRWVSTAWMIDMRGDGAVQHDGFEYNWFFRRHHWRPAVGAMNAGGWVRRRRWVRLMMRPTAHKQTLPQINEPPETSGTPYTPSARGSSVPPSISNSSTNTEGYVAAIGEVWHGDVETDWERCQALMKRVGRDGRRLELWKTWLGGLLLTATPENEHSEAEKVAQATSARPKQWTEDSQMMPSEIDYAYVTQERSNVSNGLDINRQHIAAVVQAHGRDIMHSFLYPDSRAQFLDLLVRSGLMTAITPMRDVDDNTVTDMTDFWSYLRGLNESAKPT